MGLALGLDDELKKHMIFCHCEEQSDKAVGITSYMILR